MLLHIDLSGLKTTQYFTRLPIRYVATKRYTKVNGSHHDDSPLLEPTGIQIARKSLPGPTGGEHRVLLSSRRGDVVGYETAASTVWNLNQNLNYEPTQRRLSDVLPIYQSHQK